MLAVLRDGVLFGVGHKHQVFTHLHGLLHALAHAGLYIRLHRQSVYHQLYVVYLIPVHLHTLFEVGYFTIHAHFQVTLLAQLFKQLAVVALAAAHHGSQYHYFLAVKCLIDVRNDLLLAKFDHLLACIVRIGLAHARIQQAHEVIYLSYRAYCGSWVAVGRLLLYGNDRR